MKQTIRGFTLIEVMVVIAIVGILATIAFVGMRPAGEQARDTQRQADLREVQTALELYRNRYGRYPEGCNAAGTWSGQPGSGVACGVSGTPYILGSLPDRPFAEFLTPLPRDPKLNSAVAQSGYMYVTNADGSVYKFMAKNTVEAEDGRIDYDHPFKSCDITYDIDLLLPFQRNAMVANGFAQACDPPSSETGVTAGCDIALCDRVFNSNRYSGQVSPPVQCRNAHPQFESSYAVWGGIANITDPFFLQAGREDQARANIERETENIICRIP